MYDLLGPLILFASVMSLTPGPNVVLVTASAAAACAGRPVRSTTGSGSGPGPAMSWHGLPWRTW